MKSLGYVLALLLFLPQPPREGKVASEYDKKADFATYKTYTWVEGRKATVPLGHELLVKGIEKEMSARGLTKDDSGQAHLTVAYYTLRTSYVDLKEVEKLEREGYKEQAQIYDMGKLVVVVRERSTKRQLWAANTLEPLSADPAARERTINDAVVKLFQTYPTRK